MRHVGDGDQQPPALAAPLAIHGVVEVARGVAVDGHQRQFGNVHASGAILSFHLVGNLARLRPRRRREFERQFVLSERDFDFHPRIGVIAEHFDDAPHRARRFRRLRNQLHRHHLPGVGAFAARRDEDVLRQPLVLRRHHPHAMFVEHAPDDARIDALQHFDDLAFRPSAPVDAGDAHHHAVAVQHPAHLFRFEINIVAAIVAAQEAEAVLVSLDAARDQIGLVRQQPRIAPVQQHLPFAQHGVQPPQEELALARRDVQRLAKLVEPHRHPFARQNLFDIFPTRQRRSVLLRFALKPRIGATNGAQPVAFVGLFAH